MKPSLTLTQILTFALTLTSAPSTTVRAGSCTQARKRLPNPSSGDNPDADPHSDHDLVLSMSLGVARCHALLSTFPREAGVPARATFIVDWSGAVRFMAAHRTDIPR